MANAEVISGYGPRECLDHYNRPKKVPAKSQQEDAH